MGIGEQYLRMVLSRWRLVCALVVGCTLAAWAFSVFVLAQRPTFESAARLNIVPTSEELGYASRFVRGSTFDGGSVLLGTYAEFARTNPVVAPIVDRYIAESARAEGMGERQWIAANSIPSPFSPGRIVAMLNYGEAPTVPLRDDLIANVIKNTTIETVEGTYLIRLTVAWDDPRSAAWFANALADAVIARAERTSRAAGSSLASTLEDRLGTKQRELADTLRRSRELKSSVGVVDIDRQKQSLLEARLAEQAQLTTDRANLDASESQVAGLRRQAGGKLSSAQGVLEQTIATEAPRASGLKRSVEIREGRLRQIDAQLASYGGVEDRIKALDDRAAALQTEVTALTERVSFSQTENLANVPRIQLIERATPPLTRSSPKIFFNTLLGFVAGCALAGCALLLLGPAPVRRRADVVDAVEPSDPAFVRPTDADQDNGQPEHHAAAPPSPTASVRPIRGHGPVPAPAAAPARFPASPLPAAHALAPAMTLGATALAISPVAEPVLPDPQPAPALVEHRSPHALPRPADGQAYTVGEARAAADLLTRWLFEALAPDTRPLFIAAAGPDLDAQQLSQILYGHYRRSGLRLRIVDATQPDRSFARHEGKPFVYLGGLGESARADAVAAIPADGFLVLAVDRADQQDGRWRERLPRDLAVPVHVVAFEG